MATSKFVTVETPNGNVKWDTGVQWKARAKKLARKYGQQPEILNAILGIETVGVVNMVTATLTRNQMDNGSDGSVIQFKKPAPKRTTGKRAQKKAAAKPVQDGQEKMKTKTRRRNLGKAAKTLPTDKASRLQIIEYLKLGSKNQLVLVEADSRTLLLSVTGDKVTYLTDIGQMTTH